MVVTAHGDVRCKTHKPDFACLLLAFEKSMQETFCEEMNEAHLFVWLRWTAAAQGKHPSPPEVLGTKTHKRCSFLWCTWWICWQRWRCTSEHYVHVFMWFSVIIRLHYKKSIYHIRIAKMVCEKKKRNKRNIVCSYTHLPEWRRSEMGAAPSPWQLPPNSDANIAAIQFVATATKDKMFSPNIQPTNFTPQVQRRNCTKKKKKSPAETLKR